jgi:hypothetical protein
LSKFILGCGDNSSWNETLSSSIVDFMLDHFSIMLQIPVTIENALKHTASETASVPLPQTSDKTTCDQRNVLADRVGCNFNKSMDVYILFGSLLF